MSAKTSSRYIIIFFTIQILPAKCTRSPFGKYYTVGLGSSCQLSIFWNKARHLKTSRTQRSRAIGRGARRRGWSPEWSGALHPPPGNTGRIHVLRLDPFHADPTQSPQIEDGESAALPPPSPPPAGASVSATGHPPGTWRTWRLSLRR